MSKSIIACLLLKGKLAGYAVRNLTASLSLLATLTLWATAAPAANGYRTAVVETVNADNQGSSPTGYQVDTVFILQSGSWLLSPNCATTWAYFNAKDFPQFLAIVLTARATERPLTVVVDDSLPKVSGYCRVTSVQL